MDSIRLRVWLAALLLLGCTRATAAGVQLRITTYEAGASYGVEVRFPSGHALAEARARVETPGWRFAPNSGATRDSSYYFAVRADSPPGLDRVLFSIEGVRRPDGSPLPPVRLSFPTRV